MTARTTLADLITRVRVLIGDNGTTKQFTDDEVQTVLDYYQEVVIHETMSYKGTPSSTGTTYLNYFSRTNYEEDATLQDPVYATVTAGDDDVFDYINGRYVFAATQTPNLYISGKRFDVNAAAADLAEQWIAYLKTDAIDFKAGSSSFALSQKIKNLTDLVARLRANSEQGGANVIRMVRSDMDDTNERDY
jgi:hypothetical protein